jgi:hypothetical protein
VILPRQRETNPPAPVKFWIGFRWQLTRASAALIVLLTHLCLYRSAVKFSKPRLALREQRLHL